MHDLSLSYNTELNGPLTTFLSKKKPTKQDKAELLRHWIKSFEQQYSTQQKITEQDDRETNEKEKKQIEQDRNYKKRMLQIILNNEMRFYEYKKRETSKREIKKLWRNNEEQIRKDAADLWFSDIDISKIIKNIQPYL